MTPAPLDARFARLLGALAVLGPLISVIASPGITIIFVAAGLAALWYLWRAGGLTGLATAPLTLLFGALALWALLSAMWAVHPHDALTSLRGLVPLFIAVIALLGTANRLDDASRRAFGRLLILGFCLGTAVLALDVATDEWLNRLLKAWVTGKETVGGGVVDRPVILALLSSYPAAMALARLGRPRLAVALLVPAPLVSIFTNSESAQLAMLLGLVTMAAVLWLGRPLLRLLGGIAAALALAMPLLPLGPLAPDRWEAALQGVKYSALHRLYIWHFAAGRIREQPLLGWGMDASRSIPGGETLLPTGGRALSLHPHNGLLQVWLELGLPGGLLTAAFLWFCFSAVGRLDNKFAQAAAAGLLVTGLGIACLSFGIWQNWWVSTLGLVAAYAAVLAPSAAARPSR